MTYSTTVSIDFPGSAATVFEALINLGKYSLWNSGVVKINPTGSMSPGLQFESTSMVMGREVITKATVISLRINECIELVSDSGPIGYHARYTLQESLDTTKVTCVLEFELKSFALSLAHAAIESMATSRIKGDLESLRALVSNQKEQSREKTDEAYN